MKNTDYGDELFTVRFRYKKPNETTSIEMLHVQDNNVTAASNNLNFASSVALFGMYLRKSQYLNNATLKDVVNFSD